MINSFDFIRKIEGSVLNEQVCTCHTGSTTRVTDAWRLGDSGPIERRGFFRVLMYVDILPNAAGLNGLGFVVS